MSLGQSSGEVDEHSVVFAGMVLQQVAIVVVVIVSVDRRPVVQGPAMRSRVFLAVPRPSFAGQRQPARVLVVDVEGADVALGAAHQLVHVTGLDAEVRLVRV